MIFQNEAMDVVISRLTPIKVQMQLKAWVKTEDYWEVRYRMLGEIKDVLEKSMTTNMKQETGEKVERNLST